MVLLFGTGEREKQVRIVGQLQCPHCGVTAPTAMRKHYHYFHLFYIPLFHYMVTYYVYCQECQAVYIVHSGKAKLLREYPGAVALPQELTVVRRGKKLCVKCSTPLELDDLYCPRCGERQA